MSVMDNTEYRNEKGEKTIVTSQLLLEVFEPHCNRHISIWLAYDS